MTGNEYQKLAARTINQGLTFEEQEIHALHGMVGEIVDNYQITVSKEMLSKAVALIKMMEDRGVDICEITVNAKILHDEYMRGYRKGYREGRDVIVGNIKDKMKELKNEIAMQNNEKCCRCEFENMCFFAYVCLSDNYSFYLEKENLLND